MLQPDGENEGAAHAGLALQPDLAAHQLHQAPADGQPETGAAVFAGGGHVRLGERLEQLAGLLLGHADAGVAHGELQLHLVAGLFEQFDLEPDLALLGELHRVVDQVGEDLAEAERVAAQVLGDRGRHVGEELQAFLVGLLRGQRGDRADHFVELEIDGLHVELAGLDLREIQDVVDDAEQRGAGVVDLADVVALLRVERGFEREVGQADDGVHRRADLVAHVREEHGLHLGGSFRRFFGSEQFRFHLLERGDVLIDTIHEADLAILAPHQRSGGVQPHNASIGRPLVSVDRVIVVVSALDGPLILFSRLHGEVRVRFQDPREPLVLQVIAAVGPDLLAHDSCGAFGLIIIVRVAIIHVPVAAVGQLQRHVG